MSQLERQVLDCVAAHAPLDVQQLVNTMRPLDLGTRSVDIKIASLALVERGACRLNEHWQLLPAAAR